MATPLLYLDFSQVVVIVKCRECEYWNAMRFGKIEAWRAAAAHEERTHPGHHGARDALAHAIRHAEKKAQLSAV